MEKSNFIIIVKIQCDSRSAQFLFVPETSPFLKIDPKYNAKLKVNIFYISSKSSFLKGDDTFLRNIRCLKIQCDLLPFRKEHFRDLFALIVLKMIYLAYLTLINDSHFIRPLVYY